MKAALRDLVARQEEYFSTHGTYTTDLSALGTYGPGKSRPDSALVQVIFAGGRGWTGLATHPGAKGRSCVIFIGVRDELPKVPATMGQKLVAQQEAVPLCDAM